MFIESQGSDGIMWGTEITFEVRESLEGGYEARALGHPIFTQAEDWKELKYMLRDAVHCHFDPGEKPKLIHIHFVRDEVIEVGEPVSEIEEVVAA
jgi:hypothetical protein